MVQTNMKKLLLVFLYLFIVVAAAVPSNKNRKVTRGIEIDAKESGKEQINQKTVDVSQKNNQNNAQTKSETQEIQANIAADQNNLNKDAIENKDEQSIVQDKDDKIEQQSYKGNENQIASEGLPIHESKIKITEIEQDKNQNDDKDHTTQEIPLTQMNSPKDDTDQQVNDGDHANSSPERSEVKIQSPENKIELQDEKMRETEQKLEKDFNSANSEDALKEETVVSPENETKSEEQIDSQPKDDKFDIENKEVQIAEESTDSPVPEVALTTKIEVENKEELEVAKSIDNQFSAEIIEENNDLNKINNSISDEFKESNNEEEVITDIENQENKTTSEQVENEQVENASIQNESNDDDYLEDDDDIGLIDKDYQISPNEEKVTINPEPELSSFSNVEDESIITEIRTEESIEDIIINPEIIKNHLHENEERVESSEISFFETGLNWVKELKFDLSEENIHLLKEYTSKAHMHMKVYIPYPYDYASFIIIGYILFSIISCILSVMLCGCRIVRSFLLYLV